MKVRGRVMCWGFKWRAKNRLDGTTEYFPFGTTEGGAALPLVFRSRAAARAWVQTHYGYIAKRPDLRAEPHGWKMPQVVRVSVVVTEEPR